MRTLRTDFEVRNGCGTLLYTSSDQPLARSKAKALSAIHTGVTVDEVEVFEARRVVYRPRAAAPAPHQFRQPAVTPSPLPAILGA